MYQQYFNFTTAPFSIAPDPQFIYMSEQHQEGLAHLLYGINQGGGFVALTGEVGTGKTTLCQCLLQQLPEQVDTALILNPKLNAVELLASICDELQINYQQQLQSLKYLVDQLNHHLLDSHAQGRRTVLIIDEAQNLSFSVLEQIRLLTNLETHQTKLLQIILLGQPELKQILNTASLRQLNQRITARYHLTALSAQETRLYIKHRLKVSGGNSNLFPPQVIKIIYRYSRGIPRLINILCDRALLGAYASDSYQINNKSIHLAAKEIFNSTPGRKKTLLYKMLYLAPAILLFGMLLYFLNNETTKQARVILKGNLLTHSKQQLTAAKMNTLPGSQFLNRQPQELTTAIQQLAAKWQLADNTIHDCASLESAGLYCLFDQTGGENLLALNRPLIMELKLNQGEKTYLVLNAVENQQAVLLFEQEMRIPFAQLLQYWDGYYLMLWQPPIPSITELHPGSHSDAVLWLRQRLAAITSAQHTDQPSFFDQPLKQAVIQFQLQHNLKPDGIVGPRTFIHLQNTDPLNAAPRLRIVD